MDIRINNGDSMDFEMDESMDPEACFTAGECGWSPFITFLHSLFHCFFCYFSSLYTVHLMHFFKLFFNLLCVSIMFCGSVEVCTTAAHY